MAPDEQTQPTQKDLLARAADLGVEGRSSMSKPELADAIARAEAAAATNTAAAAAQTEAQEATAGVTASLTDPVEPSPPDVVGRPELAELAEQRAARRESTMRVIGSPTQED